jgi:hypothetical protein
MRDTHRDLQCVYGTFLNVISGAAGTFWNVNGNRQSGTQLPEKHLAKYQGNQAGVDQWWWGGGEGQAWRNHSDSSSCHEKPSSQAHQAQVQLMRCRTL